MFEHILVALMVLLFLVTVWYYDRREDRLHAELCMLKYGVNYEPKPDDVEQVRQANAAIRQRLAALDTNSDYDPVLSEAFKTTMHVGHIGKRQPGRPQMVSTYLGSVD